MDKLRFAVGRDDAFSSAWVIWAHNDSLYIGGIGRSGVSKFSFHGEEYCQLATTKEHWTKMPEAGIPQPAERQNMSWRRLPTPDHGLLHVASLIFPTDYLRGQAKSGKPKKPLLVIPSAPRGRAVVVGIFYSREDPNLFCQGGVKPIYISKLTTGEYVSVAVGERAFDINELGKLPSTVSNFQALTKQAATLQPGDIRDGMTAMLYNDPNEDDHRRLLLVEIGGVSIRKNAPSEGAIPHLRVVPVQRGQ
jgi:hypothetical protein